MNPFLSIFPLKDVFHDITDLMTKSWKVKILDNVIVELGLPSKQLVII